MRKLIFTALLMMPFIADAHTLWDVPAPRNTNDNVKVGPCGPQGVAANVKPVVANPANTYLVGSTINISWFETINHTGYFWVDLAAADAALLDYNPNDPNPLNNTRATVWRLSPAAPANFPDNNDLSGFKFENQVTLPAGVTCANCTMRLVQFMEGRAQPYYYSCADVKILSVQEAANASAVSFASTVHPVLRTNCVACHDAGGTGPAHSVQSPGDSHNFVIQNNFVNFADPAASQLVAFAADPTHAQGFTGPQVGAQMEAQMTAWIQGAGKLIASVAPNDLPQPNTSGGGENTGQGGEGSFSSNSPGSQSQFGGCGSIGGGGGGPGGPMSFLFILLLPLLALYAGKVSPITLRR